METININYPGSSMESNVQPVVLPTSKGIIIIPAQQIFRIQSISNYSKIFFSPSKEVIKTLVVAKVLCWFEEQAALISFVRIHRTHFINTRYIKSYSTKGGLVTLYNGETFSVARRKKAGLSQRLNSLNNSCADESVYTTQFPTKKILAA